MGNRLGRARVGLALSAALGLLGACPVDAQVRVATLDELRRAVSPGDVVSVVQTTGGSIKGRLLRLGTADLEIRAEIEERGRPRRRDDITIPFSAVQSLERRRDSSRNGTAIGAAVGAGISGAMFVSAAAVDWNEVDEWAPIYLGYGAVFSGVGALVGWAVDSGRSKPHVRFDRRSTSALELRVAPLASRRAGVVVMMSF